MNEIVVKSAINVPSHASSLFRPIITKNEWRARGFVTAAAPGSTAALAVDADDVQRKLAERVGADPPYGHTNSRFFDGEIRSVWRRSWRPVRLDWRRFIP